MLAGAARKPVGDVVLCDVAREETSVVLDGLKALHLEEVGSIAIETIETHISHASAQAVEAAAGSPSDAVIWEQVTARTSESAELNASFLIFMVLAALITAVGIFLDSPILIVGGMVVGPEFGPIAGLCVALISRRRELAARSAIALAVGFPLAILATLLAAAIFKETGITPAVFTEADHQFSQQIAHPDFLAFFIAVCAGMAGVLSLSTAKSGAIVGVLISVTTIPAVANVGIAAAYGEFGSMGGSLAQLGLNIVGILLAGLATLGVQRLLYRRRHARHQARTGPAGRLSHK